MGRNDWLIGDRRSAATDRIYTAAADLVSRKGLAGFTIEALATKVHCSPATIYRQVGGKTVILEGVIQRYSASIVESVREAIAGLSGSDRIVTAIIVALERVRAEPLGQLVMGAVRPDDHSGLVTSSPVVARLAEEMVGRADPLAAQYLIRIYFALWYWPVNDRDTEYRLVQRFVGPSFETHPPESSHRTH
jgi:AcrR family transcriptional regulator